jgi:Aldo/keto reductase family
LASLPGSISGRDLQRELVPMLEAEKLGLLVWSPLAGGLVSGRFSRDHQKPEGSRRSEFDFPVVDKERTWNVIDVLKPIAKAHDGDKGGSQIGSSKLAGVHTKVLAGDPALAGFYSILLFVPAHTTIQAHSHRDDRMATVVSGNWQIGMCILQGASRREPANLFTSCHIRGSQRHERPSRPQCTRTE